MQSEHQFVRPNVVRYIGRHLATDLDAGFLTAGEYDAIMHSLRVLSKNGAAPPEVTPKLIKAPEAAELLAISYAEFRKLASEGAFPFKRRILGKSVRYYYPDIVAFMRNGGLDDDKTKEELNEK